MLVLLVVATGSLVTMPAVAKAETLRGVTIENWPYVALRKNGQFEGFCIELLNELFKVLGHGYTLKLVDDGKYGGWLTPNGTLDGVIGELSRGVGCRGEHIL